jgi:hypothetical protein
MLCSLLQIPGTGGQTGAEADGHICVMAGLVSCRAESLDRPATALTAAGVIYDIAQKALAEIHAGSWNGR